MTGVGLLLTILIGALAGWLAEQIMAARHGLLMNIVMGIIGALVGNAILGAVMGFEAVGLLANLVVATGGACLVIFLVRAIRRV